MQTTYPVVVTAYIVEGKPDPSAEAAFANSDRANQWARFLAQYGGYSNVYVTENGATYEVRA